jgi:hypothetical protein
MPLPPGSSRRDAIDAHLTSPWPSRADAGRRLLEAEPMPVGDWDEVKREIEDDYAQRFEA